MAWTKYKRRFDTDYFEHLYMIRMNIKSCIEIEKDPIKIDYMNYSKVEEFMR